MGTNTNSINSSPPPPPQQQPKQHVVLFPFMSKGHTIPLLQLARRLLRRRRDLAVTFFTTAANRPFIENSLAGAGAAVISLPFRANIAGVPSGVESTDSLPSMSLFDAFAAATEPMRPHFDQALRSLLPRVSFIVSDGFLWWTQLSADELSVPRFAFYGMSNYAAAVCRDVVVNGALGDGHDDGALVTVPSFPWIKVTARDFDPIFRDPKSDPVHSEFVMKAAGATARSSGLIVNSFREIEAVFADYCDRECGPKSHYVGPLCIDDQAPSAFHDQHQWLQRWLGSRSNVLYVAFGSQAEISSEQIGEIAKGLEESEVSFLWVMRERDEGLPEGFEERVRERGVVVREWVDQREILRHESVEGFLSHCGWNSVMESVCAAVPILAWPVAADQPLNARMVAEEIRVGLRVVKSECNSGLVKWEELKESVKELMGGERGKEVRERVKEVAAAARRAVGEGGSSWRAIDSLVDVACRE